jgi:hypothetical protein
MLCVVPMGQASAKRVLMSALGQKQTYAMHQPMSALPPKATLNAFISSVRYRPIVKGRKTMSAAQARRWRGRADLLNDLRVLIRRCRIKAAFNTPRDKGFELCARHTLRNWGDGGLELSRYQRCNHPHELEGMRPRRSHQRRLAQRRPRIAKIAEEVFG